jgi:hypothetical protein
MFIYDQIRGAHAVRQNIVSNIFNVAALPADIETFSVEIFSASSV